MTFNTLPDFSDSTCHFWGQVAFAKGIDKSPAHDNLLQALLSGKPNDEQRFMIHAWEKGWDAAQQMQCEMRLDNLNFLKARRHRPAQPQANPEKKGTRP